MRGSGRHSIVIALLGIAFSSEEAVNLGKEGDVARTSGSRGGQGGGVEGGEEVVQKQRFCTCALPLPVRFGPRAESRITRFYCGLQQVLLGFCLSGGD